MEVKSVDLEDVPGVKIAIFRVLFFFCDAVIQQKVKRFASLLFDERYFFVNLKKKKNTRLV